MRYESGGEQRNSALDKLKQRAPSLTDQHPNVLYTMPMQTVEQLESVLRSTLALQENILGTGNEREPAATGNGGRTVKLGEQSTGTQPGDASVHAAGPGGDAGGEPTGWEEARRVFEDALRYGTAVSEGWGGSAEHVPPLDAYDVHRRGGGVHGVQHSDADLAEITEKIVRLLSRLEGSASDEVVDCTTRVYHGDRKALTKEREQKIAMGHKTDDHEEQQMM